MDRKGSISLDKNGVVIRYSQSLKEILGYGADEINGNYFKTLAPKGMEANFSALVDSSVLSPVTGRRMEFKRKDGSKAEVNLSVYPLRKRTGEVYSFVVIVTTGSDAAERPGILTEEFQRIFRFANDAVAVTDKDGSIIDVNQAFLDTYGYKREEVLGLNPRVLKSHHSTKELYQKMWNDILNPEKGYWRGEIINRAKDGREVPVLLSINAIKDESGEIRNFLGIAFNMTRQKELDRLNKMYIDHIVHDLRGPLTTITINSELLLMQIGFAIPEKAKKKLDVICASAQKIGDMTSDILDYSRAQSGTLVVKKRKASLPKLINNAVLPFEGAEKRLFLNGEPYREDILSCRDIEADDDKVQRIIYNLLSNAFKNALTEVRLTAELGEEGLKFTVSDDGKGVSAEDAEKIFEAFYQTDEGIKTGGAGLGLNIVKSFVEVHGGKVWVEPNTGSGATFGFFIPA